MMPAVEKGNDSLILALRRFGEWGKWNNAL